MTIDNIKLSGVDCDLCGVGAAYLIPLCLNQIWVVQMIDKFHLFLYFRTENGTLNP